MLTAFFCLVCLMLSVLVGPIVAKLSWLALDDFGNYLLPYLPPSKPEPRSRYSQPEEESDPTVGAAWVGTIIAVFLSFLAGVAGAYKLALLFAITCGAIPALFILCILLIGVACNQIKLFCQPRLEGPWKKLDGLYTSLKSRVGKARS